MTMRFKEVTNRLNAPVNYPGDTSDGKPLNVAIPHMGNVRIWQAIHGGYSWSIMHEPGHPDWNEEQRTKWVGYTATYRLLDHNNSSQTIHVDGGPRDSFSKAESACERAWKQIRNAS